MRVVGIIPARLQSKRLPGKLLLEETGKPLIQYTWEAAARADSLAEVIVATDSAEIASRCARFGARCDITGEHPSGTDRIAEVARRTKGDIFVNIQGDEPEIEPAHIDVLVETLVQNLAADMATLGTPIRDLRDRDDPSCVKIVCASDGRALYFSRAPVPFCRDLDPQQALHMESPWMLHVGIYAYRREYLLKLTQLPPSRLEQLEKLEQLRALEAGATIQVAVVDHRTVGIDTPDDYARFVERQRSRAA